MNFAVTENCAVLGVIHIARELGMNKSEIVDAAWRLFRNSLTSSYKSSVTDDLGRRHIREYINLIMSEEMTKTLLERTESISMIKPNMDINKAIEEMNVPENNKRFENLLKRKFYKKSRLAEIIFTNMQNTFEDFIKRIDKKSKTLKTGDL
jgi:hypothetical protein